MLDLNAVGTVLERVRRQRPLVHLITNFVTMNIVADALRAVGARPVMASACEEVAEMTASASALVLNLGTPVPERLRAMRTSGELAHARGIPLVFDPVGVGATHLRTTWALQFLTVVRPDVIRGNSGEIAALAGRRGTVSGVDTRIRADTSEEDLEAEAHQVAQRWKTTVASTGAMNWLCDGSRAGAIKNGHPYLPLVTGTGDMASALIGACLAVEGDAFVAAASGLLALGLAGEHAGAEAHGPGSFRIALIDALHGLTIQQVVGEGHVSIASWINNDEHQRGARQNLL